VIFYYCPDAFHFPSGGTRQLYRHVDILNAHGIDAAVLHDKPGFRLTWFRNDTQTEYIPETTATPEDIVVLPEGFAHGLPNIFPGLRKVIFNQNCFYTFTNYPLGYTGIFHYESAMAVLTASAEGARYLAYAFPRARIYSTCYGIDPALFHYDPIAQRHQIALMPRKNAEDVKQVLGMLRARGHECPVVPIHDASFEDAARVLRESSIFLSFGHPEGFGLPPLEAMACGCTVTGYHGVGGKEFFHEPYAFPIEFGDIVAYVQTVERILLGDLTIDPLVAAAFVRDTYPPEREAALLLEAWAGILAL